MITHHIAEREELKTTRLCDPVVLRGPTTMKNAEVYLLDEGR